MGPKKTARVEIKGKGKGKSSSKRRVEDRDREESEERQRREEERQRMEEEARERDEAEEGAGEPEVPESDAGSTVSLATDKRNDLGSYNFLQRRNKTWWNSSETMIVYITRAATTIPVV